MKIAMVGTGNVGKALAPALKAAGHDLVYAVRNPADPKYANGEIVAKSLAEAGDWAEAIILAVHWEAVDEVLAGLGPITGKVLIDPINAVSLQDLTLQVPGHTSVAQIIRSKTDARVVKAFNQVGAAVMVDAHDRRPKPVQFAASDDEQAKAVALRLMRDIGFDARDAGGLASARELEAMARLWITQAFGHGMAPDTGWCLVGADHLNG